MNIPDTAGIRVPPPVYYEDRDQEQGYDHGGGAVRNCIRTERSLD
jgi:hypothetical protein